MSAHPRIPPTLREVNWDDFDAALFDLDGVLTPTAEVHMRAWDKMFNELLTARGVSEPYTDQDYFDYVDGKPRYDGVRSFLTSRDIELPDGSPEDGSSAQTVCGLGNRKNDTFALVLADEGVQPYPASVRLLDHLARRGDGRRGRLVLAQRDGRARCGRTRRPVHRRRGRSRVGGRGSSREAVTADLRGGRRAGRSDGGPVGGVRGRGVRCPGRPRRAVRARRRRRPRRRRRRAAVGRRRRRGGRPRRAHLVTREPPLDANGPLDVADPLDRTRFPIDEWKLTEVYPSSDDLGTTETLFAVGNGYLGMRGNLEEGRETHAHGTFINGFHETWDIRHAE